VEIAGEAVMKAEVKRGPLPWYMNPLLWIAAGGILLLVLLLVYLFTGPKFEYQNLVLEGEEGIGKSPLFFVDYAYGIKKQKSEGTEELEKAVTVKVKGGGRCYISQGSRDILIRVNGRKVAGSFALTEGNLVEVQRGTQTFTYRFHERPVAPEDLKDDEFVLMEYDDQDDFVIADDDEVPEYDPYAGHEPEPESPHPHHEAAPHGWIDEEEEHPEEGETGEGTLEAFEPESEAAFDDLVTPKPPSELVTADPLPMPEVPEEEAPPEPPEEPEGAAGLDDAVTLMGITSDGQITQSDIAEAKEASPPPEPEAVPFDDAGTLMDLTSIESRSEEEAGEGEGSPEKTEGEFTDKQGALAFDDMETFLGPLTQEGGASEEEEREEEKEEEKKEDEGEEETEAS
jgi:hypothetical protein